MVADKSRLNTVLNLPLEPAAEARMNAMSPAERLAGAERILGDLLEHMAARQPVLFIIEDVHWADSSTLGYVAALVRQAAISNAVVLLTSRPMPEDLQHQWQQQTRGTA
jgi:predicted ATPase